MESNLLNVPKFSSNVSKLLWNQCTIYKGIFIAFDEERANTYLYICDSLDGSKVEHLNSFARNDLVPALFVEDELISLTPTGKTSAMPVPGHHLDAYHNGHDPIQVSNVLDL
ncbi:WD repeat-containing protein 19-like [Parasteatoda tepidariorum]|uniref:WD repeat-containing protein 19-like n=1 Tax=Parasteatoda tepidariorum TaxID=114398 RepID=UPI001C728A79|nr:WD repeat-containing protein 19-like [Parasteatoda tepidariorum]